MITSTQEFDIELLNALESLGEACKAVDGHKISTYPDLLRNYRTKPASLLCYRKNQLIGFAACYFFELNAAEISIMIHPAYRCKGYGRTLLKQLLEAIQTERPVEHVCFYTPQNSHPSFLAYEAFHYENSEYEMQYQGSIPLLLNLNPLEMRLATHDDMEALCRIDKACFPATHPYSEHRFNTLLSRDDQRIFLAILNGQIVGKGHLFWDQKIARLSDIAVLPSMQNQGIGRKIIAYCIHHALAIPRKIITLSVETHNTNALVLYQHMGFQTTNALDYWRGLIQQIDFPE